MLIDLEDEAISSLWYRDSREHVHLVRVIAHDHIELYSTRVDEGTKYKVRCLSQP